jgi:PTH1 family peptidyl-tRNA hydrolase
MRLGPGIRLIAGLGNPGREYDGTRHNIGFAILDLLAQRLGARFSRESKWDAFVARIPDVDIALLKPTTFMNLSGEAVGEYARFHRIDAASTLVVLDDVALPLGTLRLRRDGGSGGQNGLKSVLIHFSTEQVPRLRVGVGGADSSERGGGDLSSHVLSRFRPEEESAAAEVISRAADAILCALNQGLSHAMNLYNATSSITKNKDNTANQP